MYFSHSERSVLRSLKASYFLSAWLSWMGTIGEGGDGFDLGVDFLDGFDKLFFVGVK